MLIAPGVAIPPRHLARHIGVFGATGTGKTTTAAALVSRAPCPVLVIDAKGDLERAGTLLRPAMQLDAMGPDFTARALELSDAQAGILQIAFAYAEDTGAPLVTLQDLRDVLAALPGDYGLVTPSSVAAVQRAILRLDRACPWLFRAAPDWRKVQGVTVIGAAPIAEIPGLYGTFAAHVLDSLYRGLAELGDVQPGLLVMIDEAHLMFQDAPLAIVRRIEQVTRLIRSRGVGLIYVTQSPSDLPDGIFGQLATRIQHGLRGATPRQQKAIRAAAETMPGNVAPADIAGLGVGQAIVSVPDARGRPVAARRVQVTPGTLAMGAVPFIPPDVRRRPVAVAVAMRAESFWWRMARPVVLIWGGFLALYLLI